MNKRNSLIFAAWALGGFGLTLAIVSPGRLDAISPESPTVGNVSLTPTPIKGVELTLLYADQRAAVGQINLQPDSPVEIQLCARNTTGESAELDADVSIRSTSILSMSRVPTLPLEVWKRHEAISLAPNETRTILLSPDSVRPTSGTRLTVSLTSNGQSIQPLNLYSPMKAVSRKK